MTKTSRQEQEIGFRLLPASLETLKNLAEGGGIEPRTDQGAHGFQDRLPTIQRHPPLVEGAGLDPDTIRVVRND